MSKLTSRVEDLVDLAFPGEYRLEGDDYSIPCFIHGDKPGKRRLYISKKTGLWICFRCEETGNFRRLVYLLARENGAVEPSDFLSGLEDWEEDPKVLKPKKPKRKRVEVKPPEGTIDLADKRDKGLVEKQRRKALRYLLSRGVSEKVALRYGCRVGITDKYAGYILFPIISPVTMSPVGWTSRAFVNRVKKSLRSSVSEDIPFDSFPFGLHIAVNRFHEVVLVEGVFDALPHGPKFLALLGSTLTKGQHASLVASNFNKITVMLDRDAKLKSRKIAKSLRMHVPEVRYAVIEDAKDPGEATYKQVQYAINNSIRI